MENELMEYASNLVDMCFVPELMEGIDSICVQEQQFDDHRKLLAHQLPKLFDFMRQHSDLIIYNSNHMALEIFGRLLILLCELTTERDAPYKLNDGKLLRNANELLRRVTFIPSNLQHIIFSYYCDKLQQHKWRNHIGCLYSFERFLKYHFNGISSEMESEWLSFSLSVGIYARESHEPVCKQIGLSIFLSMLATKQRSKIRFLNIHSVIYESVLKNIYSMGSIQDTMDTWNCIYKCLELYDELDGYFWSKIDDSIEAIQQNILLTPNNEVALCLWSYMTRLCVHFSHNKKEINILLSNDWQNPGTLTKYRMLGAANSSHTTFRWARKLLDLIISESFRIIQKTNTSKLLLLEMHKCYIVYILPINLAVVRNLLIPFLEKFSGILIQLAAMQKESFPMLVKEFFETFIYQLEIISPNDEALNNIYNAFQKVLDHKTFK